MKFVGTHADYDRIDESKVSQFTGHDMDIRPIPTDQDHRAALQAIEACWGEGTEDGDELDVLLALVEIHEARRWPIEIDATFDPIDVLRYAIDELGHTQAELAEVQLRLWLRMSACDRAEQPGAGQDNGRLTNGAMMECCR